MYQDSDAGDGCLVGTSSGTHVYNLHAPTQFVDSEGSPAQTVVSDSTGNLPLLQLSIKILCIALALAFVALVALPDMAAVGIRRLTESLRAFVSWFVSIALVFKESIVCLCCRLFSVGKTQNHQIWQSRGFRPDFRVISFELLAIAPLTLY